MQRSVIVVASIFSTLAGLHTANAATIFLEDFSGATPGTYGGAVSGTQFTAINGNIDIVGQLNGNFFTCVANPAGNCADLVGNGGNGGITTTAGLSLTAGSQYTIAFTEVLQGYSPGDSATSSYSVSLGDGAITLISTPSISLRSYTFTQSTTGLFNLSLLTLTPADSSHGAVISGISVSEVSGAVPEPSTWAMMLLGFGGLGLVLRLRTRRAEAGA